MPYSLTPKQTPKLGLGACSVLMHRARLFTQSPATYALNEPKPMPYSLTPK